MRRANYDKIAVPNLVPCSNCSAPSLPHRVCAACGFYRGKAVLRTPDVASDGEAGGASAGTTDAAE
jgi:large subunit ribosomal protein L32